MTQQHFPLPQTKEQIPVFRCLPLKRLLLSPPQPKLQLLVEATTSCKSAINHDMANYSYSTTNPAAANNKPTVPHARRCTVLYYCSAPDPNYVVKLADFTPAHSPPSATDHAAASK